MSMYTQLLDAAFMQRVPVLVRPTEHSAVEAVRRSRGQLREALPPRTDPDAVPVVLAREIGYDLSLLELAALLGIETDPSRLTSRCTNACAWSRRSRTAASCCIRGTDPKKPRPLRPKGDQPARLMCRCIIAFRPNGCDLPVDATAHLCKLSAVRSPALHRLTRRTALGRDVPAMPTMEGAEQ
jgi:hypothetical protein